MRVFFRFVGNLWIIRWVRRLFERFIFDERSACWIRRLFVVVISAWFVFWGYRLFETPIPSGWLEELHHRPIITFFPVLALQAGYYFLYGFRHMIIPVGAFIGALLAGALYVQDIYELPSWTLGLRYIVAAFLGIGYPHLTVSDGKKQIPEGEINLIDRIGGPGYVHIQPGNAVIFEGLRSPSQVHASEVAFISRFETIGEVVSLEDQHGFIEKVTARTKDGIMMEVTDIHYRYRLRTGRRFGDFEVRNEIDPYPYSVQAVYDMAYRRSVSLSMTSLGQRIPELTTWHRSIGLAVEGVIQGYIRAHQFDHLTAPTQDDDPRTAIETNMMSRGIRERLRNLGAELLWFDIGHFDISKEEIKEKEIKTFKDAVEAQRVDNWGSRWEGDAIIERSYGEAQRLARQDIARAEAQAELLSGIVRGLEMANLENNMPGLTDEQRQIQRGRDLRAIIWSHIAQILDATAEKERKSKSSDK